MVNANEPSGDGQQSASGAADGGDASKDQKVAYETYQKVLSEKKNAAEKLKSLEAEVAHMKAQKEADEEAKLQETKNLKGLAELRERQKKEADDRALAAERKLNEIQTTLQGAVKTGALMEAFTAPVKQQYLKFIDAKDVVLDEQGNPELNSVKEVAKKYEESYPDFFDRGAGGQIPNQSASKPGKTLSVEEWSKLPLKEQKEKMAEVFQSVSKK